MNLKTCTLGIELGSTRIKGVLLDENHKIGASGSFDWENRLENGIWTYPIEEVAAEYEGKAVIGKCDTDAEGELAMQFGVRNIPMLVFLKNGEVKDVHVGTIKKSELTAKIDSLL